MKISLSIFTLLIQLNLNAQENHGIKYKIEMEIPATARKLERTSECDAACLLLLSYQPNGYQIMNLSLNNRGQALSDGELFQFWQHLTAKMSERPDLKVFCQKMLANMQTSLEEMKK